MPHDASLRDDLSMRMSMGRAGRSAPVKPLSSSGQALILVVERDPHIRKLEQFFLEQAGYRVEFADDGLQGLERARILRPRIVVAEIMLPGLDGLTVCRALKSEPATRSIAVLVFSILSAEDRALEAGADAFLRKPLNDETLVETVSNLLRKSSEER
jgi:CheY-like chemotaxis protein